MKRLILFVLVNLFILINFTYYLYAVDDLKLWKEFVQLVKNGEFTEDMIRPHFESLRKPLIDFIIEMKDKAPWEELEAQPEIIRVNDQINYLVPLTFDSSKTTYCFTCIEENGQLYFKHLETIFIRLDKITSLPTSEFPDLSNYQKNWAREEIDWSKKVQLFNYLTKEKGKEFAFNWFKDGVGYFIGAKTWVPFIAPKNAFILYLCWEQSKLRGSEIKLEKLEDNEAIVQISPQPIAIYMRAAHLKQQISFEDYVQLFATIWEDRAEKAGWHLEITGGGWPITFHFKSDSSIAK